MKHLKLFEDINFDEWDEEEFDGYEYILDELRDELNLLEKGYSDYLILILNEKVFNKIEKICKEYGFIISRLKKYTSRNRKIFVYLRKNDKYGSYLDYNSSIASSHNNKYYPESKIIDLT